MSYHSYVVNGYGISDEYEDLKTTKEQIEALLATAHKLATDVHNEFGFDYTVEDIDDYDGNCGMMGILALLCDAINENEDVQFWADNDYDGLYYVLYTPAYPWEMEEHEKRITEKDIEEILAKYTTILFGHPFKVDYYRCENGC